MDQNDILNFKDSIANLSVDELEQKRSELEQKLSKLVLESDIVMKVAIIESLITDKLKKETSDGSSSTRKN